MQYSVYIQCKFLLKAYILVNICMIHIWCWRTVFIVHIQWSLKVKNFKMVYLGKKLYCQNVIHMQKKNIMVNMQLSVEYIVCQYSILSKCLNFSFVIFSIQTGIDMVQYMSGCHNGVACIEKGKKKIHLYIFLSSFLQLQHL